MVTPETLIGKSRKQALERLKRLPGGAERIEVLKQAGQLRFEADGNR